MSWILGFKVHFPRNMDLVLLEISTHVFNLIIPLIEYRQVKHKLDSRAIFFIGGTILFYLFILLLLYIFDYLDEIPYIYIK